MLLCDVMDELEEGEICDDICVISVKLNKNDLTKSKKYSPKKTNIVTPNRVLLRTPAKALPKAYRKPYVCKNHQKVTYREKTKIVKREGEPLTKASIKKVHLTRSVHEKSSHEFNYHKNVKNSVLVPDAHHSKAVNVDKHKNFAKDTRSQNILHKRTPAYEKANRSASSKPEFKIDIDSSYEELLDQYKEIRSQLKNLHEANRRDRAASTPREVKTRQHSKLRTSNYKQPNSPVRSVKLKHSTIHEAKCNHSTPKQSSNKKSIGNTFSSTPSHVKKVVVETGLKNNKNKDVEEEDLELLRQKALATCAKLPPTPPLTESPKAEFRKESPENVVSSPKLNCAALSFLGDNYEIVDMDVSSDEDDDITNGVEQVEQSNSNEDAMIENGHVIVSCDDEDDDDSDEEILRAKLILSLRQNKPETESSPTEQITKAENIENDSDFKSSVNDNNLITLTNPEIDDKHPVVSLNAIQEAKQIEAAPIIDAESTSSELMKSSVYQNENPIIEPPIIEPTISVTCRSDNLSTRKVHLKHKPLPFMVQKPVQPVVIQLGQDSTDSESENEELQFNHSPFLASLERLIENEKNKCAPEAVPPKTVEMEPKIVSCLPMSQQAEYTKLKEILAQKDSGKSDLAKIEAARLEAKASADAYNLLLKKLHLAHSTYQKENQLFSMLKIQANKRKSAFITSQLEFQRLKEQLVVAEKVKNTRQRLMFAANVKLATVQKSVSKRKELIEQLEKECTNKGIQLFGSNFSLPSLQMNSPFKFKSMPS